MFGRKRAQRRRARKQTERVLTDARTAAAAARKALRESRVASKGQPPGEDELADAVQTAILGSILPFVNEAGRGSRKRDDKGGDSGALAFLIGLGIGVGVAAWARHDDDPDSDLPEDDEWELADRSSTKAIKAAINETLDKADVAIRQAARATAQTMGTAVGTIADAAGPTAELVTDKLKVARSKATSEVIRTLDDLDDVWDDDTEDSDKPSKTPMAKKPTPRKPVVGKPPTSAAKSGAARRPRASGSIK